MDFENDCRLEESVNKRTALDCVRKKLENLADLNLKVVNQMILIHFLKICKDFDHPYLSPDQGHLTL